MWDTATCVPEGSKYSEKLSAERHEELDEMNLRDVTHFFNSTALSADTGSLVNQTYCFGLEYLSHCTKYYGPHSVECLETLWDYAHCIPEGDKYPKKILQQELDRHDSMNLREIIAEFNGTKSSADSEDVPNQMYCFGIKYPSGCNTYYGPYFIPCLNTIWDSVGCLAVGTEYPPKLPSATVDSFTRTGLRLCPERDDDWSSS